MTLWTPGCSVGGCGRDLPSSTDYGKNVAHTVSSGARMGVAVTAPPYTNELRPASPPARRPRRSRWRDPRLWLGVLLVVGAMLAGAKVFAAADDSVGVWQAQTDLPQGAAISSADLKVARVHFDHPADVATYLTADTAVPVGTRLARDVSAGELLARTALTSRVQAAQQLPLSVAAAGMLPDLHPGDRVNVWAVPSSDQARASSAEVLHEVSVLSIGPVSAAGLTSDRQVVVALPARTRVAGVLDALADADVVLIRVAG